MVIRVERIANKPTYCVGHVYVNGVFECDSLEPHCINWSKENKVEGKTAVPEGKYPIDMNTPSPSFGGKEPYKTLCNGKLPRLKGTTTHQGVLIHCGNFPKDTKACLLVGKNDKVGQVSNSKVAFTKLYTKMKAAHDKGETITIEYIKKYK